MIDRTSMLARYPLRMRFAFDPITGAEILEPGAAGAPPVVPPVDAGFPAGTAPADMTVEQQVAYWKHHSRRHEATADSRKDYDELKTKAATADALTAANATEADKALAAARAEGKTEGANVYLEVAVRGELRALTGKTLVELEAALDLIDVTKLTLADGSLDLVKITAFAKTLGGTPAKTHEVIPPVDSTKDIFDRVSPVPPAGALSLKDAAKARVKELSPSTK